MCAYNYQQTVTFIMVDVVESSAGLNLFSKPTVYRKALRGHVERIRPINTMTHAGPYEFEIGGSSDYIQSPHSYLDFEMRIMKSTLTGDVELISTDKVTTCNLPGHSLFSSIELSSRNEIVSDQSSSLYGYKALIETLINYSPFTSGGHLVCSGFEMDTPGQMEFDPTKAKSGATKRSEQWKLSRWVQMCLPLHLDLFNVQTDYPGGMQLRLKFIRKPDNFTIMQETSNTATYVIQLRNMAMNIRKVTPNPALVLEHELAFAKSDCVYDYNLSVIKQVTMGVGANLHVMPNLFKGQIPPLLILGIVETAQVVGDKHKNPFTFNHHNVQRMTCKINGQVRPVQPLDLDWGDKETGLIQLYRQFNDHIGVKNMNVATYIDYKFFKDGCTLYAFDSTPNGYIHSDVQNPTENGNLDLEITLKAITASSLTLIALGLYDRTFSITKGRDLVNTRISV